MRERLRRRAHPFALVAGGGFLGAMGRYGLAEFVPGVFPWGTLAANVGGTFLLSVLLYEAHLADLVSAETRLLVGTGFCSSFTTYSTFAVETTQLSPQLSAVNVAANYALGFLAVLFGQVVTRWVS